MAITNHERVGKALELLRAGLTPFVEREFKAKFGDGWAFEIRESLTDTRLGAGKGETINDVAAGENAGDVGLRLVIDEDVAVLVGLDDAVEDRRVWNVADR